MNQTFKKKALAASVALALVGGPIYAVANQFAGSGVDGLTAKNILAGDTAGLQLNTVKVSEIGSWTASGKFRVTLPSSVRLTNTSMTSATSALTMTSVNAADLLLTSAGVGTSAAGNASAYLDASNQTVVEVTLTSDAATTANDSSLGLQFHVKSPSGTAVGDVVATISDGDAASGTGGLNVNSHSVTIAKVVSTVVAPTVATTTNSVVGLTNQTASDVTLTLVSTLAVSSAATKTFDITLGGGATFSASPTIDFTEAVAQAEGSVALTGSTTAQITLTTTGADYTMAVGDKISLTGAYLNLTNATAGAITATITSSGSKAITSFGTHTATLTNAGSKGSTLTFVDSDGTTGYKTVFVGRKTESVADQFKVAESVYGSLLQGGTIDVALSNGAFIAASTLTLTNSALVTACAATSAVSATAGCSVTTASTSGTGAGSTVFTIPTSNLDMGSATAGDVNVTISGTAGASGTVKIAEAITATTTSASGSLASLAYDKDNIVTANLPSIVIQENKAGALSGTAGATNADDKIVLSLSNGLVFDNSVVPTVAVTKSDGTKLTGKMQTVTSSSFITSSGGRTNDSLVLDMDAASDTTTGAYTITVSGLKVFSVVNATPIGDYSVTVYGDSTATANGAPAATDMGNGSTVGAKPYKQSVKVASVSNQSVSNIPAATVTGANTSQTITGSLVPAALDQGKLGSVFVGAILPASLGGQIYGMSSAGAWALWDGQNASFPVYSTGTLAAVPSISFAADMDVSGLVGTMIVTGYGLGGPLSPAGTAFGNMITNSTYNVTYTIK